MFPLLPALILLLLQGHTPLERGRLPATLDALQWGVVAKQYEADGHSGKAPVAQVCALLRLLAPRVDAVPESVSDEPVAAKIVEADSPSRLAKGFAKSERSRDGPRFSS